MEFAGEGDHRERRQQRGLCRVRCVSSRSHLRSGGRVEAPCNRHHDNDPPDQAHRCGSNQLSARGSRAVGDPHPAPLFLRRPDVLVHPEEVRRVVLLLELGQPLVVGTVSRFDALGLVLGQKLM